MTQWAKVTLRLTLRVTSQKPGVYHIPIAIIMRQSRTRLPQQCHVVCAACTTLSCRGLQLVRTSAPATCPHERASIRVYVCTYLRKESIVTPHTSLNSNARTCERSRSSTRAAGSAQGSGPAPAAGATEAIRAIVLGDSLCLLHALWAPGSHDMCAAIKGIRLWGYCDGSAR